MLLHRPRKVSVTSTPWTEGLEPAVDRPSPARLACNWVFLRESWGTGQAGLTRAEERRPGVAPEECGQGGRAPGQEGGRHLGCLSQAAASSCDKTPGHVFAKTSKQNSHQSNLEWSPQIQACVHTSVSCICAFVQRDIQTNTPRILPLASWHQQFP